MKRGHHQGRRNKRPKIKHDSRRVRVKVKQHLVEERLEESNRAFIEFLSAFGAK